MTVEFDRDDARIDSTIDDEPRQSLRPVRTLSSPTASS